MAMTVNPQVKPSGKAPFRDEGIYSFRFDTDGDNHEDVSFKVRLGASGSSGRAGRTHKRSTGSGR